MIPVENTRTEVKVEPPKVSFWTDELSTAGLADKKLGMSMKAIINFDVTERTKSFATLRLNHIYLTEKKRTY